MSSHFGNIEGVFVDTYADFKNIISQPESGLVVYCEHIGHYTVAIDFEGFKFMRVIKRADPKTAEETEFDTDQKSSSIKIS